MEHETEQLRPLNDYNKTYHNKKIVGHDGKKKNYRREIEKRTVVVCLVFFILIFRCESR